MMTEAPETRRGGAAAQVQGQPMPMPLVIVSGVSFCLFVILPILVRKGPNRGIARCCIMLTVFSLWIFWATVYISQMRPLMGPQMHNTTLAWMKYIWKVQRGNVSDANATVTNATEAESLDLYLD